MQFQKFTDAIYQSLHNKQISGRSAKLNGDRETVKIVGGRKRTLHVGFYDCNAIVGGRFVTEGSNNSGELSFNCYTQVGPDGELGLDE